jgi:hypothetical protein
LRVLPLPGRGLQWPVHLGTCRLLGADHRFPTRGEWSNHERLANAARLIFCKPACEFTGRFLIDATFSLISASADSSDTKSTQQDLAVDFPQLRRTGTACASESVGARPP